MEQDTELTSVVFRKYPDGDIIALFPEVDEGNYKISSYMHVGQHGAADYEGVVESTKLATPEEYADLKRELEYVYGYNFKIYKKKRPDYSKFAYLRRMRDVYFNEFEVIDGLNQHPSGKNFQEWLQDQ